MRNRAENWRTREATAIRRVTDGPRGQRGFRVRRPSTDRDTLNRVLLTLLLGVMAAGGGLDLWLDLPNSPGAIHLAFETALLILSLGAVIYLWSGWMRARRSVLRTRELATARLAERDAWRARAEKLLRGLGEEIDAQLRDWSLTPAERETALLLLKGYEHKEIAALLGKSERTVRQQAISVYRKSNLSGRAELAAFFLEDLLLPAEDEAERGGAAEQGPDPGP